MYNFGFLENVFLKNGKMENMEFWKHFFFEQWKNAHTKNEILGENHETWENQTFWNVGKIVFLENGKMEHFGILEKWKIGTF